MVTLFKNIYDKEPFYKPVEYALARIKDGASEKKVNEIRTCFDKERASKMKSNLPSICFSGKFGANRTDTDLLEHSGYIVLDFDSIVDVEALKHVMIAKDFVRACWVSPSGNGVKALVKIASPEKHREHFQSLLEDFPEIDRSGINPSRVCYESFDPDIFIKDDVKPYKKTKTISRVKETVAVTDNSKVFDQLLIWLTNKGDAFVSGERNQFIFKLASACCRFGLGEDETIQYINYSVLTNDNSFTLSEATATIRSAFKSNRQKSGSASFEQDVLVDNVSRKEVEVNDAIYNVDIKPKDVIFGEDVKQEAINIYLNGYEAATSTEIPEIDLKWKWNRGELTLLTGIGNYGKSTFLKYLLLMKAMKSNWKFALFAPEDFPAHEFYHDVSEMLAGQNLTPSNANRISLSNYSEIYSWVSQHFFFVYPKDIKSTPEYIKERFLELIIKEKVDAVIIDPFNQMDNDYSVAGGRDDKYLEIVLADFKRFAQVNNTHFLIVAHPNKLKKDHEGNYEMPDVFDISGGAMWNNKMDNILVYHRPLRGSNPEATNCSFTSKKVRRQKIVGLPGTVEFNLQRGTRRFEFNGVDYIDKFCQENLVTSMDQMINPKQDYTDAPF